MLSGFLAITSFTLLIRVGYTACEEDQDFDVVSLIFLIIFFSVGCGIWGKGG